MTDDADKVEVITLRDVQRNGEILVLHDGRKLCISPSGASSASLWTPSTVLVISKDENNLTFSLNVRNTRNDVEISAMWIHAR